MKPVDSKQKMLSLTELVLTAGYSQFTERDPREAMMMIVAELSMPTTKHMRLGNTLFIIDKGRGRNGYMRALNADTAQNFMEHNKKFADSAYLLGFDNLITIFKEPAFIQIFRMIAKKPPRPEMGYELKEGKNGEYIVNFKLGPSREGEPEWVR
jgi:hypothetical protein